MGKLQEQVRKIIGEKNIGIENLDNNPSFIEAGFSTQQSSNDNLVTCLKKCRLIGSVLDENRASHNVGFDDSVSLVVFDKGRNFRKLARVVPSQYLQVYSLYQDGSGMIPEIILNPLYVSGDINENYWADVISSALYYDTSSFWGNSKKIMQDIINGLYIEKHDSHRVTMHKVYKKLERILYAGDIRKSGSDMTKHVIEMMLEGISGFNNKNTPEYNIFSKEDNFNNINSNGIGMGFEDFLVMCKNRIVVFEVGQMPQGFYEMFRDIVVLGIRKLTELYMTMGRNVMETFIIDNTGEPSRFSHLGRDYTDKVYEFNISNRNTHAILQACPSGISWIDDSMTDTELNAILSAGSWKTSLDWYPFKITGDKYIHDAIKLLNKTKYEVEIR